MRRIGGPHAFAVHRWLIVMALGLGCGWASGAFAQTMPSLSENLIERLSMTAVALWPQTLQDAYDDGDLDRDTFAWLLVRIHDPLPVNEASFDALTAIPGMSAQWAQEVIDHRPIGRGYASLDELATVLRAAGMDVPVWVVVQSFLTILSNAAPLSITARHPVQARVASGVTASTTLPANAAHALRSPVPRGFLHGQLRLATGDHAQPWRVSSYVITQMQPMTSAAWDGAYGVMKASQRTGAGNTQGGVQLANRTWTVTLGHYLAGFGERVVFAHTSWMNTQDVEHTVDLNERMWNDLRHGTWETQKGALGAALAWQYRTNSDHVHATLGLSAAHQDVYQNDVTYGTDEWYGTHACTSSASCPDGYTCNTAQHQCVSRRFVRADDPNTEVQATTFSQAMRERMLLGNITWTHGFSRATLRLGLTGYGSATHFTWQDAGSPPFTLSDSAVYPQRHRFGAGGILGVYRMGAWVIAGEYARTDHGGDGATARLAWQPARGWLQAGLAWRLYGPEFDNPHAHSMAASDETWGNRARNELGVRSWWLVRGKGAWRRWRWSNDVDLWTPTHGITSKSSPAHWERLPAPHLGVMGSSQAWWRMTGASASFVRGMVRHAPDQIWRYGAVLGLSTTPWRGWSLSINAMLQWHHGLSHDATPASHRYRIRSALDLWRGARMVLGAAYRHDRTFSHPHGWDVMVTMAQAIGGDWWMQVRYGAFGFGGVGSVSPQTVAHAGFALLQWRWASQ